MRYLTAFVGIIGMLTGTALAERGAGQASADPHQSRPADRRQVGDVAP